MQKAPDMRVFNASVANNHGVYDACLVRTFRQYSNWTHADFTEVPVTEGHYIEHTRGLVVATLKKELSLPPTFGTGNKTFLPTDLAFRMVRELGGRYHVQRDPIDTAIGEISASLHMGMKAKGLVVEPDTHPLHGHFRAYGERTADTTTGGDIHQTWIKMIDMQPEEMRVVSTLAHMSRKDLLSLMTKIQPFLTERDDTHTRSPLLDLRNRLRAIVERNFALTNELRRELFEIIYADWQENLDMAAVDRANEDLVAETGDPKILESTIDDILRRGFIEPLSKGMGKTTERKDQLLRRKVILESLFLQMIDEKKWEHVDVLTETHDAYIDNLGLKLGELGYLALINLTMTSKVDSIEKLTNVLH